MSTPHKNKWGRTIAKVLNIRAIGAGIAPVDGSHKPSRKSRELGIHHQKVNGKPQDDKLKDIDFNRFDLDEELEEKMAMEAILAKLFASLSTIKSAYAQLQFSTSPYDADGIQSGDQTVVSELKNLSELKRCYLKKQFDPSPERALVEAEIQEQKSLLKTYEITVKKLESQVRLKESEATFLREKLDEANKQNRMLEKRLNQSGQLLSVLDNLHLSGLNPSHFSTVLAHTVKSIRSFMRVVMDEMKSANWDIHTAAHTVHPEVIYWKEEHKCFAFESFISQEMFEGFSYPNYHAPKDSYPKRKPREKYFARFMELKSTKTKDYLLNKPKSAFANFCRIKYAKLVHPKMEFSFFGNLNQRNHVNSGDFSAVISSTFFASFAEMARRAWLLHSMAFSFDPEASIFQVPKGSRFSEVYMQSIAEEVFPNLENPENNNNNNNNAIESDSQVAFTVIPGFRIGKTVIQSKVYLSQMMIER